MYEIPWFKVEASIFTNRKIKILLGLPDGDTYFRAWIQIISIAVECCNQGRLIIGNKPMTIQDFSKIMGKSKKKIEKIITKFVELEMLNLDGETYLIKNWDKYQTIDKYEKYLKQNRARQEKYREKNKSEIGKNNVTEMSQETEEESRKNKEKNIEEKIKREESENGFREYKL